MDKLYERVTSHSAKFLNLVATLAFLIVAGVEAKAQYCPSAATSTGDDEIFNVTFGSLNNTSVCGDLGPGPGSLPFQYSNYTTLPATNYVVGNNYPFSVTGGQCNGNAYSGIVGAWIDYNHNGVFTDPGEEIFMSNYGLFAVAGTVNSAPSGVTIPATALAGLTTLRVILTESSTNPGPCTSPTWGETEDYTINIVPATPFNIGVSALIKPVNLKRCFTVDTIVARVVNSGTATANFATTPATVTVRSTGIITANYTLAVNSGTIPAFGSKDYTITTNYNMTTEGDYKLKAYTTAVGDPYAPDDTTQVTVRRKPFFNINLFPNDTVCRDIPVVTTNTLDPFFRVGTGNSSNSSTTYPSPYGNYYQGAKHQFLVLASELTAAGVTPGNITAVSFNAINLNGVLPLDGMSLGIATTTLTSLTAFEPGVPTFFSATSYTPSLGYNRHTLSTPFNWNGTSNLIVQTCFNNYLQSNNTSANVSFSSSNTPFSSSVWYSSSYQTGICGVSFTSGSGPLRPDIFFDQVIPVTYSWGPATGLSSTSAPSPTINAPATTNYTVVANYPGCTTRGIVHVEIKPTPLPNLGSDTTVCNMPQTLSPHITGSSYLWSNNFTSQTININNPGKYWVRVTGPNGCAGTDTVRVFQGATPVVTLGPDTAYCQGSSMVLYAGNPGSTYLWSTGSTASSITVSSPGTYSVTVTHPSSCKRSDVVNVSVKPLPNVSLTFVNPEIFCPTNNTGRPLTEGTPAGGTYIGSGVSGNSFNASQAGQGTYVILYNYTGPNGCSNVAKDTLRVYACVGVEELASEIGLNVYPNPSNGFFTLEVSTTDAINATVQVTTIDGRIVYNDMLKGNGMITKDVDISALANGIYYLRLESKNQVKTFKVLKQ